MLSVYESESVCAYDFKCHIQTEGLLKVTGSHVIMYTTKVATSRKRRTIETLSLPCIISKIDQNIGKIAKYPVYLSSLLG